MTKLSASVKKDEAHPSPHGKPRVMIVITKADVGGAQVHVLQILSALRGKFEFLLVAGEEGFLTRTARTQGVQVLICHKLVRPISPLKDIAATREMVRLIKNYRPAFVHAHSFKSGFVVRLAARVTRVPSLFTAHGWSFTPGVPVAQKILGLCTEALLCRLCEAVITISEHDFKLAKRFRIGSSERRHLIPNAAASIEKLATPQNTPVRLLTIGRLTPVKNQSLMLRAMIHLPDDVTLTVVGEGSERPALLQLRTELGLEDRVTLYGEVQDVTPFLHAAQIFVLTSRYEGLPISILEAMSAGLPVVSTDVGGIREAVLPGKTGLLVPRGDLAAMIAGLEQLIDDPEMRCRLGAAGRHHYEAHYKLSRFIGQMTNVYRDMPRKQWKDTSSSEADAV